MKRIHHLLLVTFIGVLAPVPSGADGYPGERQRRGLHSLPYGEAGCGWGSDLVDRDQQVLAATTNGISFNQTFAISSGTSNCTDYEKHARGIPLFLEYNQLALEREISQGGGETLATLSHLMGCPPGLLEQRSRLALRDRPAGESFGEAFLGIVREDEPLRNACEWF